jgi:nickel/cobalt exporter
LETSTLYSILTLAFGLGLLHALDADHIMAVSSLSMSSRNSCPWKATRTLGFCFRWALGHGAVLVSLAFLFLLLKLELPSIVPLFAEKIIGLLLFGIGCWIFYSLWTRRLSLELHAHDDVTHVHLTERGRKHHTHQPILIGITHGLAGSAPVLALIPATNQGSAIVGVLYVMLFCLGVLISMLAFGLFFSKLQDWIAGFGQRLFQASRMLIASLAICIGGYWLWM